MNKIKHSVSGCKWILFLEGNQENIILLKGRKKDGK